MSGAIRLGVGVRYKRGMSPFDHLQKVDQLLMPKLLISLITNASGKGNDRLLLNSEPRCILLTTPNVVVLRVSGGCVVGPCWEACSSWVSVPLFGLPSWLRG